MRDIIKAGMAPEGGGNVWEFLLGSGLFALFGFIFAADFFSIDVKESSLLQKFGLGAIGGSFGLAAAGFSKISLWFGELMNGTATWGIWIFFFGLVSYLLAMFYVFSLTKGYKLAADSVDYIRMRRREYRKEYRNRYQRRR